MILVIDNYDSFTFNLVQALQAAGADVRVVRNDAIDRAGRRGAGRRPGRGPARDRHLARAGRPGRRRRLGRTRSGSPPTRRIPLLGVCLGMQSMAAAFGAAIVRAPTLVHGEASRGDPRRRGLLAGMPPAFMAARYHSLVRRPGDAPRRAARDRDERGGRRDHGHPPRRRCRSRASSSTPRVVLTPGGSAPARQLPAPRRRGRGVAGSTTRPGSFATAGTGRGAGPAVGRGRPMSELVRAALAAVVDGRTLVDGRGARGDGRGHGRRGDAGPAGGAARGPADARRDGRRAGRVRRRDARAGRARRGARRARSTSSGPAATAAGRSTSRRPRRSSSRPPACRSPSTATGRSPRRSGSADVLDALGIRIDHDAASAGAAPARARLRVPVRAELPPGDAPRRPDPARDRRADRVQPARPADQPGRRDAGSCSGSATRPRRRGWPRSSRRLGHRADVRRPRRRRRRAAARRQRRALRRRPATASSAHAIDAAALGLQACAPTARAGRRDAPRRTPALIEAILARRAGRAARRRAAQRRRRAAGRRRGRARSRTGIERAALTIDAGLARRAARARCAPSAGRPRRRAGATA